MNSFFAAVELLSHPELSGKPVAVSGDPKNRHGIILAKNEPAKAMGVVTAETIWQARRKCPDLVLLPPHMDKYEDYSRRINEIYNQYTDKVEPFSIDESWLDVTGSALLFGTGKAIADELRGRIRKELGLTLSVGVSFNKVFAKLGSDYKKPDATTCITRENFRDLLWTLPADRMLFVGAATFAKLQRSGIATIGDLALAEDRLLERLLGKQGLQLKRYALGEDDSPVQSAEYRQTLKSVGNSTTYPRDLVTWEEYKTALLALADSVSTRLRRRELRAGGVRLEIKGADFAVQSRQCLLDAPANTAEDLLSTALALLSESWTTGRPVRLFQLTAIHLSSEDVQEQLTLFDDGNPIREKAESIGRAMDEIRDKYGSGAIAFGNPKKKKPDPEGGPDDDGR
jgi:DNA polymerase-4